MNRFPSYIPKPLSKAEAQRVVTAYRRKFPKMYEALKDKYALDSCAICGEDVLETGTCPDCSGVHND